MYSNSQSADADQLITDHAPLVKRLAYHLIGRLPASVLVDDLIQAGMIGLLDAARQYDAKQGASFETYATIRVRGAMIDELRRNDWAPKSVHKKSRDVDAAVKAIEARTGTDAKDSEIAEEMGISLDDYYHILQDTNSARLFSLDEVGHTDESLINTIPDQAGLPLDGLTDDRFRDSLAEAITKLPEREQMVLSMYYDNELNLREIGEVLGVSESRISQILSQSHARLRSRLTDWLPSESS
ncbi:MAG: RNA polymerase sigma factor FliA [Gammaproteobacteria bacterium]|nr:RNA polymerase sigma factor FliA [Gammaproteobacteria bacterium]